MINPLPLLAASATVALGAGVQISDLLAIRSVGAARISPDGLRVAYTVIRNDAGHRPIPQIWIMNLADGSSSPLDTGVEPSMEPTWSPNGKMLAYSGTLEQKQGLIVAHADGTAKRLLAPLETTNSALPDMGRTLAWAPDSKQIAFVSATPGPEAADLASDPVVITRRLFRPADKVGDTRLRDDKRLHIFVANAETGETRQLTHGDHHQHSIDWSPVANEIVYVANPESTEDSPFFNYDLYILNAATGESRHLIASENSEYRPQWSPNGTHILFEATKRGLSGLEFPMENTHFWSVRADGTGRRELTASVDSRQHDGAWSQDGKSVFFTVQQRGNVALYRIPSDGGKAEAVIQQPGEVVAWSAHGDKLVYALATPADKAQLYLKTGTGAPRQLTNLNETVFAGKQLGRVESFTFPSYDNRFTIEAFLTYPAAFDPVRKYPMVVVIHGGPHFQQGVAFDFKNQAYAAAGFATLLVNFRGSTGYGQTFTDAVFRDQNGGEAQDVLYGVSAAVRRNAWIDRDRLGVEGLSYGGLLTAWLVTQTNRFKAAVATSALTNLISYNYTTNYHQWQHMEWGQFIHESNLMDVLWERSPLKHVAQARTPVLMAHGENDNDVPIGEAEQFFSALRDIGTPSVLIRYPREGHGIQEPKHVQDWIVRSLAWYTKYFN